MFLSQRPWHLIYYFLLAKLFNAKVIIWCRGELRNYYNHHPLRRITNKFLLKNADMILLRELYMKDILVRASIYDAEKTIFFPNAIPVLDVQEKINQSKNVLFLNSFKSFRNLELIIEAASITKDKYPEIKFNLVGSTFKNKGYSPSSQDYEQRLRDLVNEKNLNQTVNFFPFSSSRFKYLSDAFVFVLPADIVFCNYTLLEAMSQEIPSIVADVEGSDLIVENNKTGFILPRDADSISEGIIKLYENQDLQKKMGMNSRAKIIKDFNVIERAKKLSKIYKQ